MAELGFLRASLDFPGGVQAAIEQLRRAQSALGLWARIPHYLVTPPGTLPYPAGSLALIEALNQVGTLDLPVGDLPTQAAATRKRLDELIANNPDHQAMLRQLEAAYEEAAAPETIQPSDLPTGDELAAELERFLRDQPGDGWRGTERRAAP